MLSKEQEAEDFQYWLDYMDDAIDAFLARLPENVRTRLDYSIDSLDALEGWLLDRYPDCEIMKAETDSLVFDGAARYIGETFRKIIGGHWWVDLVNNTYGGWYQITDFCERPTPVCPLALATTSIDRRRGNFISTVVRNYQTYLRERGQ